MNFIRNNFLPFILLAAAVAFSFSSAINNTFAWDDIYLVVKNPDIKNWDYILTLFKSGYWSSIGKTGGLYRPLTMLSFMAEYSLSGLNPLLYHIDNIILHFLCSILVYMVLKEILKEGRAPLLAALIFAAHPVHSEAVAWVSGRAELLSAFFLLASFFLFIKKNSSKLKYVASTFLFLLGLLSKETAVVLPAIILFYTFIIRKERRVSTLFKDIATYLAVFAAYLPVRLMVLSGDIGPTQTIFQDVKGYWSFLAMNKVFIYYIKLMFFPMDLSAAYLFPPPESFSSPSVLLFWTAFATAAFFTPVLYKKRPIALFFMVWFFVSLIPVSNIIPTEILMAERVLYLPSVGFCGFFCALFFTGYKNKDRVVVSALAYSIIFIFSFLTFGRNGVWRDESSIHKELISINLREIKEFPAYGQLYSNLANSYMVLGNYEEAGRALEKANELDPSNPAAHFKLAAILKMKGKPLEALEELKKSLNERTPFPDEVYANMAAIYHDLGRMPEAEAHIKKALKMRPQVSNYHLNFGMLLLEKGEQESALDEFITAGRLDPDSFDAFFQQGLLYGGKKEFGKSIESLNRAVEIDPDSPEAHFYLGAAYESSENRALALKEARKAIELRPGYPQAKRLLELMR